MRIPAVNDKWACFSQDRKYRYLLGRRVGAGERLLLFIMLNPSTADAARDDPTIRRCRAIAARWGFGRFEAVNLFAYRAAQPRVLFAAAAPVGPRNDAFIIDAVARADAVLLAWGSHAARPAHRPRAAAAMRMAMPETPKRKPLYRLGFTALNEPRHPLARIPTPQKPIAWTSEEIARYLKAHSPDADAAPRS